MKDIQAFLVKEDTLNHLCSYETHEPKPLAKLLQLIVQLLEVLGLYTPILVRHVDKLLQGVEGSRATTNPSIKTKGFLFFPETERNNIKNRAKQLRADGDEDEPSPVGGTPPV